MNVIQNNEIEMNFRLKAYILGLMLAAGVASMAAQSLDDAKELYRDGEYAQALPIFEKLLAKKPKDATLNHWTGVCLMKTGRFDEAIPLLKFGHSRKVIESPRYLAEIAFSQYRADDAADYLDAYQTALDKNKREMPVEVEELQRRVTKMRAMLDRVERIEIIDSIAVDADAFFEAYRMTAESGSLNSAEVLPRGVDAVENAVVYMPESKTTMIWAAADENGKSTLVRSSVLSDGKWEHPHKLGDILNEGGDANYPFMLSDGITLYFANNGENSLGGYDIFISRHDENEFFQPQNIGMPYNSLYDDYMLAIDEMTGVGWWATDRNRLDGKVTIYKFIPKDMRENYPVDEPRLRQLAMVSNYRDTWAEGADYSDILQAVEEIGEESQVVERDFEFAMPDGQIYTQWSDFVSDEARNAMKEYVAALKDHETTRTALEQLRRRYAQGATELNDMILRMEEKLRDDRELLRSLSNDVVRLEQNN